MVSYSSSATSSGIGPVSVAVFALSTMAIAIPTGVKIVNWTLTMWGGKLRFTTAMLFAITVVEMVTAAQQYGARNFQYLEPITLAGVIFLLASYPTSILIRRLEKSLVY